MLNIKYVITSKENDNIFNSESHPCKRLICKTNIHKYDLIATHFWHQYLLQIGINSHLFQVMIVPLYSSIYRRGKINQELFCRQVPAIKKPLWYVYSDMALKAHFPLGKPRDFFCANKQKVNAIGWWWRQCLSPANQNAFLSVCANKFAWWKTRFNVRHSRSNVDSSIVEALLVILWVVVLYPSVGLLFCIHQLGCCFISISFSIGNRGNSMAQLTCLFCFEAICRLNSNLIGWQWLPTLALFADFCD